VFNFLDSKVKNRFAFELFNLQIALEMVLIENCREGNNIFYNCHTLNLNIQMFSSC